MRQFYRKKIFLNSLAIILLGVVVIILLFNIKIGSDMPFESRFDTSVFEQQARNADCADTTNELYIIDEAMVFWNREGNCNDASYTYTLYGTTPEQVLCKAYDSIAGPKIQCTDETQQPLFNTILDHLNRTTLGLGNEHIVRKISIEK